MLSLVSNKHRVLLSALLASGGVALMGGYMLLINFGIGGGLGTYIYWTLNGVAWVGTAMAILGGLGLGAVAAQAIWAMVKKVSLKVFLKW